VSPLAKVLLDLLDSRSDATCRELRSRVGRLFPRFKGHSQQDPQEFMLCILDQIEVESKKSSTSNIFQSTYFYEKLTTSYLCGHVILIFLDLCCSHLCSLINSSSLQLKAPNERTEVNQMLQLHLENEGDKVQLTTIINYYYKPRLPEDPVFCSDCKKRVKCSSMYEPISTPKHFLVTLSRFGSAR
jgi:uncharacterized UBP type Zn finger protein